MIKFPPSILLFIVYFGLNSYAFSAKITASVDATSISQNDVFTFKIEAKDAESNPKVDITPLLKNFSVVSGPSQQTSMSWINGKMQTSRNLTWTLVPMKTGTLTIPSLSVSVGNKSFRTKTIRMKVSRGKQLAESKDLFLTVELDKSEVYVGEQVTVIYKLFTRVNMSIQGLEMPKFVGFWVEELFAPNRVEYRKVNLKGVQYNVAQLYSGALFPTKTGELFLDPMKVKCNVTVKNKKRRKSIWNDPFFDSFSRQQTVPKVLLTEKTLINVKPYPDGKPADFTGAVGSFTLAAFADMKSVKANEAITLKVKLHGTGNISMFSLPEFDFPQTLEVFPPTSTIKKEPLRDNITGSVSWEYILIPRQEGRFIIPRIELPFFDSKTEEWNRTSTRPIQISVLPGETSAEVSSGLTKEEVVLLGSDIRYIRREIPQWIYRKYSGLSFEILTLYGLSLIFFISPGFMKNIQRNKGGTEDIRRSKKALKTAMRALNKTQGDVFLHASRIQYRYLKDRFLLSTDNLDPLTAESLLVNSIPDGELKELIHMLKICDTGQYAPGKKAEEKSLITDVKSLLKRIDAHA
jgi:hypothetical protein